ncbi:Anaphase-promoting complex subunit 10 [Caenorhabditis elegans]|nr:Anaphase-promoting complex subunit 10 [Caenorhabditis elegans]CAA98261.2 Anaphase-promoting complex subunit 10 [Caenorhabditis elegans]|eukprot:NP_001256220.1 Anaphase-promoting complex subunit 10 [Caenorhabditis elegans]
MDEEERTSSRGWMREFKYPSNLRDITEEARISLSSVAHCGGVDELLHESSELAWRTNMSPPHRALFTFSKKTDISYVMLFLDYSRDESYCPQEVRIDLGDGTNDWWLKMYRRVDQPKGWVKIPIHDAFGNPLRVMSLQMTIMKNHEKGRDCVVRHFRVLGPFRSRYDSMNRMILGPSAVLEARPGTEPIKDAIMNHYQSMR